MFFCSGGGESFFSPIVERAKKVGSQTAALKIAINEIFTRFYFRKIDFLVFQHFAHILGLCLHH